jgi:2-polyprenyl-6-methoxyphenol hydroxylase-like FAD-dependent oxidoreductase
MNEFDLAVLGGGPAGLFCGIAAPSTMRVLVLSDRRNLAHSAEEKTLEAVPATVLALLTQYGIHPYDIGLSRLYVNREVAWDSAAPRFVPSVRMPLVERPRLEMALLTRLRGLKNVEFRSTDRSAARDPTLAGLYTARLVDATGRRAWTASKIERAPRRWVAHIWSFDGHTLNDAATGLKLASLENGYAYRLSSNSFTAVGLVGPGYRGVRSVHDVRSILSEAKAEWLLKGLNLASGRKNGSRVASLQWSIHGDAVRSVLSIGDAALARDALASQGLAASISDALYAIAATRDKFGADLLRARQVEQRTAHIRHLVDAIRRCSFRSSPTWSEYLEWLLQHPSKSARKLALMQGRIVECSLETHKTSGRGV